MVMLHMPAGSGSVPLPATTAVQPTDKWEEIEWMSANLSGPVPFTHQDIVGAYEVNKHKNEMMM